MSKEIYISSTPHETRLAIVENDALTEIYYERENEYTLAGSIYNGKVTRVLPGMQSSFVDIGLDRDAFLYITDFMEEAGDAADFESAANGGDHRRAPRTDATRSDSSRSDSGRSDFRNGDSRPDRGGRDSQPRTIAAEPSDSELFTAAVSSLDPARPVADSDRGGNRRGGRNRSRDRSFNSDGTPRRSDRQDRPDRPISGNRADVSRPDSRPESRPDGSASIIGEPPAAENSAELGEGAPGADGSRRWRGRRGRRGNRTDAPRDNAPRDNGAQLLAPPSDGEPTGPIEDAYADSYTADIYPAVAAFENFEAPSIPADRTDRGDRDGRSDRGRDRNAGSADRGGNRGERSPQAPRVPRGFAPSTSLYKVEGSADPAEAETPRYGQEIYAEAPAEPIILPGESLSKYRAGGEAPAPPSAPSSSTSPAPQSDFVAAGWDGGMVLPGETIRPRTPRPEAASSSEPRRDFGSSDRGRDNRGSRDNRDGRRDDGRRDDTRRADNRPNRDASRDPNREPDRARPAAPLQSQPAPAAEPLSDQPIPRLEGSAAPLPVAVETYLTEPESTPPSHLVTPLNTTFVPPPPMPAPLAAEPPTPAPAQEYEPSEASASYRVDPAPPSEFRQSAPVLEPEEAAAQEAELLHREEVAQSVTTSQPLERAAESMVVAHEAPASIHEVTDISPIGDMHSEPATIEATPNTHEMTQELTAPAPSAQGPELSTQPVSAEISVADQTLPSFAPGAGLLEEEMLDDEDDAQPMPALQASHELHEEETLEGAADLGTMIREMSIDQITRTEPSTLDEEDDLEEDFLEEDQDYEESDSDELDDSEGEDTEFASSDSAERDLDSGSGDESARELERAAYGSALETEPSAFDRGNAPDTREPRRDRSPDRRRDGRRGDRGRRPGSSPDRGSDRNADRSPDRSSSSLISSPDRDRRDRSRGRQTMQSTNLPAISELLKPGQEILVQIAKEPIAKKGARITSHIALPGRFLVFMPTVHHTGVSRKIESDQERRRLKEILLSEKGEAAGGFIVRTAAANATEEELRSDLRFLLNLWSDIKARSESSKSPALIYHDLNLVERVLRDQVTDTFSAIWVDTESQYEQVLRFLQRFQPSLIRRVKLYTKETPLFEQFGITEEINKALRSKVWLKSGGSIVINQTEALVAIDINTGKFVGKTARLEDTIVKTNLDAIPEIVRQIRLRDLGGIIIIDFIDMDERKNRNKVMAALEEELKSDRAPSKVLQFNDFGLVAITRKRVKQSLERTLSTTCGVCQGTGMVKSPVTVCNDIYIEMRKMHKHLDRGDVMLRVHPEVVKQLKSGTSRWLQEMEEMVGKTILVKSDPSLHPEQFDIH